MTPKEFTASRRKKITLLSGLALEIRRIGGLDLLAMGGSPDLRPLVGKPRPEVLKAVNKHLKDLFANVLAELMQEREFLEKVVLAGVVSPKVVRDTDVKGAVCIADLLQEELSLLATAILNFSFFTKQEAQRIDPLSETGDSSSTLTPSEGDTEGSQAKSSQSPESGSPPPTPSTSPAPARESPKKTLPEPA